MNNPQALRKEIEEYRKSMRDFNQKKDLEELETDLYISFSDENLRKFKILILEAELKGHTQAIKKVLEIIEEMETLDIYFNKEMAIKTLILAGRVISGELSIEDIKIKAQLNSQPSNSLNRMLEKVVPSQDKMADTSNIKAQLLEGAR